MAAVFDAPGTTFRDEMFAAYKANRPAMPDDLTAQVPLSTRWSRAFRFTTLVVPGVEADDVIGTLVTRLCLAWIECVVITGDKDLMQLVGDRRAAVGHDARPAHRRGGRRGALGRVASAGRRRHRPDGRRHRQHPRRQRHRRKDRHRPDPAFWQHREPARQLDELEQHPTCAAPSVWPRFCATTPRSRA